MSKGIDTIYTTEGVKIDFTPKVTVIPPRIHIIRQY